MTDHEVDHRPSPMPDEVTRFFWEAAATGRLVLQRCEACHRYQYPPEIVCTYCQHSGFEHVELSGGATLYTYCLVERPFHAGFVDRVPYVLALVELNEQPELRMLTNLLTAEVGRLSLGMELEVCFEQLGQLKLPQFKVVGEGT